MPDYSRHTGGRPGGEPGERRPDRLTDLLEAVGRGELPPGDAREELLRMGIAQVGDFARLDLGRHRRTGAPEIVLARGKTAGQLAAIVTSLLERAGTVLCSKVSGEQVEAVEAALGTARLTTRGGVAAGAGGGGAAGDSTSAAPRLVHHERAAMLAVTAAGYRPAEMRGVVGVIAAGTSDVGVAEEAAIVSRAMAAEVLSAYDVGVAGLHRLGEPLARMMESGAGALVVAAGMEGALPSVVAGLVDVPVIGLPTSVGYGYGGAGEAALMGMLQSCVPGLTVVNIDNGVGAGITAAMIARQAAGPCQG